MFYTSFAICIMYDENKYHKQVVLVLSVRVWPVKQSLVHQVGSGLVILVELVKNRQE